MCSCFGKLRPGGYRCCAVERHVHNRRFPVDFSARKPFACGAPPIKLQPSMHGHAVDTPASLWISCREIFSGPTKFSYETIMPGMTLGANDTNSGRVMGGRDAVWRLETGS